MKVCAYIMLHYGAEYLEACIKALDPCVDKIFIIYSQKPSHGFNAGIECPDKEWQMKFIAQNASKKVEWHSYELFHHEGEHRREAFKFSEGYDVMVNADADEVWDVESLKEAIKEAYNTDSRYIQVHHEGWFHFWKSFNHVCRDGFQPVRLHNLNSQNTDQKVVKGTIYHFGYAQSDQTMLYKLAGHGHRNEFRDKWLNMYLEWKEGVNDVHPVAVGLWNPEPFDKSTLPDILKEHDNYEKDVIC